MDDLIKNLEPQKRESFFDKLISSTLALMYSKKMRIQKYLFGLLIVGFILRLIASLNLTVLADDNKNQRVEPYLCILHQQ